MFIKELPVEVPQRTAVYSDVDSDINMYRTVPTMINSINDSHQKNSLTVFYQLSFSVICQPSSQITLASSCSSLTSSPKLSGLISLTPAFAGGSSKLLMLVSKST